MSSYIGAILSFENCVIDDALNLSQHLESIMVNRGSRCSELKFWEPGIWSHCNYVLALRLRHRRGASRGDAS